MPCLIENRSSNIGMFFEECLSRSNAARNKEARESRIEIGYNAGGTTYDLLLPLAKFINLVIYFSVRNEKYSFALMFDKVIYQAKEHLVRE